MYYIFSSWRESLASFFPASLKNMFLVSFKRYCEYLRDHICRDGGYLFLWCGLLFYGILFSQKTAYFLYYVVGFFSRYSSPLLFLGPVILFWLIVFFVGTVCFSFYSIALLRPSVSLKDRSYIKSFIDFSTGIKLLYIGLIHLSLSPLVLFFAVQHTSFLLYFTLFFCSKTFFDIFLVCLLDHKTESFFSIFKKTVRFLFYQLPFLSICCVLRSLFFFLLAALLTIFHFSYCINIVFFVLYSLLIDPFFMAFLIVFYTKRVHEQITLYS